MRFFKLTHPDYATDQEASLWNSASSTAKYRIPGMSCDVCGPWSSSDRLRVPLPSDVGDFDGVKFLPVNDWTTRRDTWAQLLGLAPEQITPGAKLGPPTGTGVSSMRGDAIHPVPGEIWVSARLKGATESAGLTGVSFARVQLRPNPGCGDLWELVIRGRAWRPDSTVEKTRLCDVCGRRGFPSPKNLSVDESRWDGSDFLTLDGNPNIIVVTERVADLLDAGAFANIVAKPIG